MEHLVTTLDRHLASRGETVTLRRQIGTSDAFVSLPVRARLSGYRAEHVVGAVKVTDSQFVMSVSEINAAGAAWPGAAGGGKWPEIGDWLVVQGRMRRIEQTKPVIIGDRAVRIDGRVLG